MKARPSRTDPLETVFGLLVVFWVIFVPEKVVVLWSADEFIAGSILNCLNENSTLIFEFGYESILFIWIDSKSSSQDPSFTASCFKKGIQVGYRCLKRSRYNDVIEV